MKETKIGNTRFIIIIPQQTQTEKSAIRDAGHTLPNPTCCAFSYKRGLCWLKVWIYDYEEGFVEVDLPFSIP